MSNLHGQIVRGYRLEDVAGSGGFGTVYRAKQEVLNREVAVKVINEKYVNKPQFIRQFEAEARIIARLEHSNIVALYDYWRDPSGAYLIMRWLKGGSLRQYLKRQQMTIPQIVRLLSQIASALAFGHQLNVIHRDIKPENILLDQTGNAFLTDFGIAVDLQNQENLDIENISFGSPDYVAPEQLTEKLITPKADIYSLGIMLYELLAHERPFRADTAKEVMQMQLRNPVPSLRLTRPDLPTEIDTIIWQATSKKPHARYDNILELAVAFQNVAATITDVPSGYNLVTETRRRHRQKLPIKQLSKDSAATGAIEGLATGVLDDSATGEIEIMETGVLDISATGKLDMDVADELDAMATGVLDETERSEMQVTGQLDAMETGLIDFAGDEGEPLDTSVLVEPEELDESDVVLTLEIVGEGAPNPYKGLNAFDEGDADTFFGREIVVKELVNQFTNPQKRFLGLIGPSGSGKSSIVRAGIIPQFRRNAVEGSEKWFISTMVPSNDPFRELSEALLRVSISAPENWGDMLRTNIQGLHNLLGMILPEEDSQLLLFIDQFEEVFTLWDDDEQREIFLGSLWYALHQKNTRLRLIITLRADFYDRPLHYQQFGELLRQNTEVVLPLNFQELGRAILEPANKVGLRIESGLANALLEDVHNQPGALPLLQYTLTELYDRRDKEAHEIHFADYEALGGISGALAERAQEIYFSRLNDAEQGLAQQLFLRLISIDENGAATRRRANWHQLMQGVEQEELENVINAFSRHRLLTTDSDPVTRIPTIEVAHEALITAWDELKTWIEDNRHALQKRQELRIETDRWLDIERDDSYLASGLRLAEFENLLDNQLLALRKEEREYIKASIYERDAELRETRLTNSRLRNRLYGVIGLTVIAFGLVVAALFLWQEASNQRAEAETQRDIAEENEETARKNAQTAFSREIAASAEDTLSQNDLSLLLSVQAITTAETHEAFNSILQGLQQFPFIQTYLQGHEAAVRAVDYNSSGTMAVSADSDKQIIRWDMSNNEIMGEPLQGHSGIINAISFSPDDSLIASAGDDDTVRLWDAATGEELANLKKHNADVWGLAFSPDGQYLATSDEDGTIIVWDVDERETLYKIGNAHNGTVYTVLYNADGTVLASGGEDNLVRLWDAETGEAIGDALAGHTNWVRALVFHAAQPHILISADQGANVIFWDTNTGEAIGQLPVVHQEGISDMAFHPLGVLATSGFDGVINLWNLRSNQLLARFIGHNSAIRSIDFLPEDRVRLISGSDDTNVIIWEYNTLARPGEGFFLAPGIAIDVFDYDEEHGRIAIVGGQSNKLPEIQIWDINTDPPEQQHQIPLDMMVEDPDAETTQLPYVSDMALSPDGTRIAVLSSIANEGVILVWDTETGNLIWSETAYQALTKSLSFINDGSQIVTSSTNGKILVWDTETGEPVDNSLTEQSMGAITDLTSHPDRHIIAINYRDEGIMLWDLEAENWLGEALKGHSGTVNTLYIDHSGDTLYSGGVDEQIISWDIATGEQLETFAVSAEVLSISTNPDDSLMVSGYTNGGVRLWNTERGRGIGNIIQSPDGNITSLFFKDDYTIWGSNREALVILQWTADVDKWIEQACTIANRSLSPEEQEEYLPPELEYSPVCVD